MADKNANGGLPNPTKYRIWVKLGKPNKMAIGNVTPEEIAGFRHWEKNFYDNIRKDIDQSERRANEKIITSDGRVGTRREIQERDFRETAQRTLKALTSNPMGALGWGFSGAFTDDPHKRATAAEMGSTVGRVGGAWAGDRAKRMERDQALDPALRTPAGDVRKFVPEPMPAPDPPEPAGAEPGASAPQSINLFFGPDAVNVNDPSGQNANTSESAGTLDVADAYNPGDAHVQSSGFQTNENEADGTTAYDPGQSFASGSLQISGAAYDPGNERDDQQQNSNAYDPGGGHDGQQYASNTYDPNGHKSVDGHDAHESGHGHFSGNLPQAQVNDVDFDAMA